MDEIIRVADVYQNQNVLLTGGTGYMGKVFVEKLLRSCPGLGKLFIITRSKFGVKMEDRWQKLISKELFQRIKDENPRALQKIVLINGDSEQLNVGISEEDTKMLIEEVNFVFNFAANVKFNTSLSDAIKSNVRSTRELCYLALKMKNLKSFIHISTCFSQCPNMTIEERIYPPYADWQKMIEISENMNKRQLDTLLPHFLGGFPNTYTFTKSLAENCLHDLLADKVPSIIIRPSYVMPTLEEPFTGWFEDILGPVGALIAAVLGLVRVGYADKDARLGWIPVDFTTKTCISSVWKKLVKTPQEDMLKVEVYNSTVDEHLQRSVFDHMTVGLETIENLGMTYMIWYPSSNATQNYWKYVIYTAIFHLYPTIFVDMALKVFGQEPFLFKSISRMITFQEVAKFFVTRTWVLKNEKTMRLVDELPPPDKPIWGFHMNYEHGELITKFVKYAKVLLLHDYDPCPRFTKFRIRMLYYLDKFVGYLFYAVILFLLVWFRRFFGITF